MPDLKISELPAATTLADTDIAPLVQATPSNTTRRASLAQLRRQVLADRGVDVRDFGAVGNGTANDAPAIQAAINALGTAGGVVHLGARTYRLASAITINGAPVQLQGQGVTDGGNPGAGTWLTVDQTGFVPITFTGTSARGSAVVDLCVRQTHGGAPVPGWTPTPYDWFFRVVDCLGGVRFDNLLLSGVNRGIFIRNSGRADIFRLRGQVFTAGIELDECFDAARIANLHFWPYFSANENIVRWQQNNGDAMIFRRVDGVFVDQSFVLGYRSMFRFSSSAAGFTQKFSIGQAYADFVRHGILVEANGTDGQIDAMTVQCELFNAAGAPLPGSTGIQVNASGSRIQIGSLRIDDAEDNAIRVEQHSNRIDIGALRVVNFNLRSNGAAAIHLVNAASGTPNRVNLGSDALLETPVMGPLVNAATNGSVGVLAPAGQAAHPGVAVGEPGSGLFRPAAGQIAAAAGGAEMLRAGAGSLTLGGPSGQHGLEVQTPASAANRVVVQGGVAGGGRVGWVAGGTDANLDAVVGQPRGNGAVLAQFPDGAAGGGAARGAHAVDLQTARSGATQVASGSHAVLGGGDRNAATGSRATVSGGQQNSASAAQAAVAGGLSNVASGQAAAIAGGSANTASGASSWVPGGSNATTRGQVGRGAWGSGQFGTVGDAQAGEYVLRAQTTNATGARMTTDGAAPGTANIVNLPNNATYRMSVLVVAQQTAGTAGTAGDCASWTADILLRRGASAATTAFVGGAAVAATPGWASVTAGTALAAGIRDAAAAGWTLTFGADTASGGLALTVTGEANKTVRWVARILTAEVTA